MCMRLLCQWGIWWQWLWRQWLRQIRWRWFLDADQRDGHIGLEGSLHHGDRDSVQLRNGWPDGER